MDTIFPVLDHSQKMFECPNPKCNWPHWFTVEQLKKKKIVITCNCGRTFRPRLEPEEEKKTAKKDDKNKILSKRICVLALAVVQTRKPKKEAIEAILAVFSDFKTLEQLIQDAIDYDC